MRYQQVFKKNIFSNAIDSANCVLLGDRDSNPTQPTLGTGNLTVGRSDSSWELSFSHL